MTGDNTLILSNFVHLVLNISPCREVILWQARAEMYNRIQSFKPKGDNI